MSIRFRQDIFTHGSTLARKMHPDDRAAILDMISDRRVVGIAHVAVTKSIIPDRLEVHFLPEDLSVEQCIPALAIALRRLMDLHGRPTTSPAIVNRADADVLLVIAGHLVDSIRKGTLSREGLLTRNFDLSRQDAVRDLFMSLVMAGVTPSALARGQ